MNPDLDTLATALYVRVDDLLGDNPGWAPERPAVGIAPKLSDAEMVTLAVISALFGFDSERRFVRYAKAHLGPWFPPQLARPADAVVGLPQVEQCRLHCCVAQRPSRQRAARHRPVHGQSHLRRGAYGINSERFAVPVDELDNHCCRRPSPPPE